MDEQRLKRDGQADLAFTGEEIASSTNQSHQGDRQNRFTTLTLYRTESGKFVLHIEYETHWQGEKNESEALVFDSLEAVKDKITDKDYIDDYEKEFLKSAGIEFVERI